jgi:hypothetical protein
MPPTVDKAGLRTVPLDEPEGWHLNYAANWATLAAFNAIGGPISVSRVAVAANYAQGVGVNYIRADATAGPITITLGAPADYTNQLIYIRKKDNSANTVTVASAALIDGAASFALAAQGTAIVTSTGTTYERVL